MYRLFPVSENDTNRHATRMPSQCSRIIHCKGERPATRLLPQAEPGRLVSRKRTHMVTRQCVAKRYTYPLRWIGCHLGRCSLKRPAARSVGLKSTQWTQAVGCAHCNVYDVSTLRNQPQVVITIRLLCIFVDQPESHSRTLPNPNPPPTPHDRHRL